MSNYSDPEPPLQCSSATLIECNEEEYLVRIQHPVPYYVVLNDNKCTFDWSIDHEKKKAVSEFKTIDLKRGQKDRDVPYMWISDLQRDLYEFGFMSIAVDPHDKAAAIPSVAKPDGDFGERTEFAVRRFQIHASTSYRRGRTVEVTYNGKINGVVDDDTKMEVALWKVAGYKRGILPFDREGLLAKQVEAGQVCPEFAEILTGRFVEVCDQEDLDVYGPSNESPDPDLYRAKHTRGTWHLMGLACDVNLYDDEKINRPLQGEFDRKWGSLKPELRRLWRAAHACGFATCPSNEKDLWDPRHVEYHPLLNNPSQPMDWTIYHEASKGMSCEQEAAAELLGQIIRKEGGNSLANVMFAWGLAVHPKHLPLGPLSESLEKCKAGEGEGSSPKQR